MKRLLIIAGFLGFAATAHAGFMIEPYIGYETGNYKYQGTSGSSASGVEYGARLGYDVLGFQFGAEYDGGSYTYKPTSGSNSTGTESDIGIFVAYKFPVLLRVFAEYGVADQLSGTNSGTTTTYKGSGTRFGVAYTGLPFIEINLELINRDFDKSNGNTITGGDFTVNTYALSISLPLP